MISNTLEIKHTIAIKVQNPTENILLFTSNSKGKTFNSGNTINTLDVFHLEVSDVASCDWMSKR